MTIVQKFWPLAVPLLLAALWVYTRMQAAEQLALEHEHALGAHGGQIASLAYDRFHLEAVTERDGLLRLYTLGRKIDRVVEVDEQSLTALVEIEGEQAAYSITLTPDPQPGDARGKTSRFTGTLPGEAAGRVARVLVPNFRLGDARYRAAFNYTAGNHLAPMPAAVTGDEEQALYFEPAGKYTSADIAANGRQSASQKYAGFQARHDANPEPGTLICPISQTKANPECTWVIDGQLYQFCCPPCIDEFVRLAKEDPAQLRPASDYVQP